MIYNPALVSWRPAPAGIYNPLFPPPPPTLTHLCGICYQQPPVLGHLLVMKIFDWCWCWSVGKGSSPFCSSKALVTPTPPIYGPSLKGCHEKGRGERSVFPSRPPWSPCEAVGLGGRGSTLSLHNTTIYYQENNFIIDLAWHFCQPLPRGLLRRDKS